MEQAEPREKMGTEIRKHFCSQLGGLQQGTAEQKASTCPLKIFRILSPGKPRQLALPGSSKEFYKGLKTFYSNFQKYCILPILTCPHIKSNTKSAYLHTVLHQSFPHYFHCHYHCQNNDFSLRTLKVIPQMVKCELSLHVNAFYTLFNIPTANSDHFRCLL